MSRPTQVSMQDVAKAADVSPQTVSRVANGSDAVKPETRQRVEAAMERLGYRPNYAARALKHGRFQDIGVVMFNTATFGNARILDSIVANAADDDYSVTIQTMRHGAERTLSAAIDRSAVGHGAPSISQMRLLQRACGVHEVLKGMLLVQSAPLLIPGASHFAAATNMRHGVQHTAMIDFVQLARAGVAGERVAHARRLIRGVAADADGVQAPGLTGQVVVASTIGR